VPGPVDKEIDMTRKIQRINKELQFQLSLLRLSVAAHESIAPDLTNGQAKELENLVATIPVRNARRS
jgi:hypothetical protein